MAASAVRDGLRRAAEGIDAVEPSPEGEVQDIDVALVLHDDVDEAPAGIRSPGVPVLQLSDVASSRPGLHLMPCRSPLPTIVESIARLAHGASSTRPVALSAREAAVATHFAQGHSLAEVSAHLGIGLESVRTYLRRARTKLCEQGHNVSSRQLLSELRERGVLAVSSETDSTAGS